MKGIKIGDNGLELNPNELDENMQTAVSQAEKNGVTVTVPACSEDSAPQQDLLEQAKQITTTAPIAAIILAWKAVELRLTFNKPWVVSDVYGHCRMPEHQTWRGLLNARKDYLDTPTMDLLTDLRKIRNEAVHKFDYAVSTDTAVYYVATVKGLLEKLDSKIPKTEE